MTTETMRSIDVNGVSLRYIDTGTGDPAARLRPRLVCDSTHWREQVPDFSTVAPRRRPRPARPRPVRQAGPGLHDRQLRRRRRGVHQDDSASTSLSSSATAWAASIVLNLAHGNAGPCRAPPCIVDAPIVPLAEALKPVSREPRSRPCKTPAYADRRRQFSSNFMFNDRLRPGAHVTTSLDGHVCRHRSA